MIEVALVETTPAASPYDSAYPTENTERLSYYILQQWEALRIAGLKFTKPETSDFSGFKASLSDYLSLAYQRETEIIQQGFSNIVANIPDILSIGAAYASGGATEAIGCILNIAIGKMLGGDSGAQGDYEQSQLEIDMAEVVEKLEALETAIHTIMNEYTINIHSDKEDVSFRGGRAF